VPVDPGSKVPVEPGSLVPVVPGSVVPVEPGSVVPVEPGSLEPVEPGSMVPVEEPPCMVPVEPGPIVPVEPPCMPPGEPMSWPALIWTAMSRPSTVLKLARTSWPSWSSDGRASRPSIVTTVSGTTCRVFFSPWADSMAISLLETIVTVPERSSSLA
jgi:hypothetical protein